MNDPEQQILQAISKTDKKIDEIIDGVVDLQTRIERIENYDIRIKKLETGHRALWQLMTCSIVLSVLIIAHAIWTYK